MKASLKPSSGIAASSSPVSGSSLRRSVRWPPPYGEALAEAPAGALHGPSPGNSSSSQAAGMGLKSVAHKEPPPKPLGKLARPGGDTTFTSKATVSCVVSVAVRSPLGAVVSSLVAPAPCSPSCPSMFPGPPPPQPTTTAAIRKATTTAMRTLVSMRFPWRTTALPPLLVSSATNTSEHVTQRSLAHLHAGLFTEVPRRGVLGSSPVWGSQKFPLIELSGVAPSSLPSLQWAQGARGGRREHAQGNGDGSVRSAPYG